MDYIFGYGLFLAKAVTIVIAIIFVLSSIISLAGKQKQGKGHLDIKSLNKHLDSIKDEAQQVLLSKEQFKKYQKDKKKEAKKSPMEESQKAKLFVLDFNGSVDAHEVDYLREEITAILCIAEKDDEVLVRLESGGGVVHGYGLAASQLQRLKDKGLKLTVSVDKVAASGGYMMACVADNILAAKFAYIGSIGVIAQLPNFNKVLQKNDIEFEQHTAGEFKRTLTMFGENTDEARSKFKQELEQIHTLFKGFVHENRPDLDIEKVATGEYWPGTEAKALGLVDELSTSDDYILKNYPERAIYAVKFNLKKGLPERLGLSAVATIEQGLLRLWNKVRSPY